MSKVKRAPTERIFAHMALSMIKSSRLRGASFITVIEGGSEASAIAAKVSMMRFTQSICVTVRGVSIPRRALMSTMKHAAIVTVIWKRMKRWMLR